MQMPGPGSAGLPVRTTLLQNNQSAMEEVSRAGLPVRTTLLQNRVGVLRVGHVLDYQSERHCSKTKTTARTTHTRWITSQNDTAPKRATSRPRRTPSWITSQNDTAPKRLRFPQDRRRRWITSQNDTAPKLSPASARRPSSWITSQNDTAPKRVERVVEVPLAGLPVRTTLLQNR